MNMKWNILLVTAFALLAGCATPIRRFGALVDIREPAPPPYWATGFDCVVLSRTDQWFPLSLLAIPDLPLAVTTDTLFLPFDTYYWLRDRRNLTIKSGNTNAVQSVSESRNITNEKGQPTNAPYSSPAPQVRKR
jgi:uncharacterized protein YceK